MNDPRTESMDDFDRFIRHSDFGKILELAGTLKDQKSKLVTMARGQHQGLCPSTAPSLSLRAKKKKLRPNEYQIDSPSFAQDDSGFYDGSAFGNSCGERPKSRRDIRRDPNAFDGAAELIRETLIPPAREGSGPKVEMMGRGECLVTDSLIDETIRSLVEELTLCMDLKKQIANSRQGSQISEPSYVGDQVNWAGADVKVEDYGEHQGGDIVDKANPIASKFSKWQTDILTDWMIENREHPFPTQAETARLAEVTNLTNTQVINWTTNVRKRNLKATVEREKKPHHFLDYLFLATDREKKLRKERPDMDFSVFDNIANKNFHSYEKVPTGQGLQDALDDHKPNEDSFQTRPKPNNHQQPDLRRSQKVAPPKVPRNTEQIFRRGKRLSNLKQMGTGELAATQPFSVAQNRAQPKQASERERRVLQAYAPHGVADIDIPPGCFEGNPSFMDDIDEGMFDEHGVASGAKDLHYLSREMPGEDVRQRNTVSFESMNMADDSPFDEDAEDYIRRLMGA